MPFQILESKAHSILNPVSGFLAQAGFTHSLSPARNCTFGCSYCYVPTMRVQGGLRPEDWRHWGEWTTFKINAPELLRKALRPHQIIYCSPLTDPYQPAEAQMELMPSILELVASDPPAAFVIQTRGPLILRDLALLQKISQNGTRLRVSFSVTTEREEVRRIFEPRCAPIKERWHVIETLVKAGISTSIAIAPILPCEPEALIEAAIAASDGPIAADPFHVRSVKRSGATTREAGVAICARYGWEQWLDPEFQQSILSRMARRAQEGGRIFGHGPEGFAKLAK